MTRLQTPSSSRREAGQRDILDTVVSVETPEGILLELRPAGLSARSYAFMVDWGIRLLCIYVAALIAALIGGVGVAFWFILIFALEWFYPVFFELSRWGATPGKRTFGLRVVMDSGLPVTPAASVTRNLLRVADFLPFGYGFAIVSMLVRSDCKRLGDLAAATVVIYEPRVTARKADDGMTPIAPAIALTPAEQAALVALAARVPTLTTERLDELAALAAPVSGDTGRSGPAVTRRVLGVAQWVLGRR
jgi:uncharacterized RDD family membrane protein YckC